MKRFKLVLLLSFVSIFATHAQRTRPYSPLLTYHVEEPGTLHEFFDVEKIKADFKTFFDNNNYPGMPVWGDFYLSNPDLYPSIYDNIKITGRINCHDIYFLTSLDYMYVYGTYVRPHLLGKLDLSEATIVGNELPYCSVWGCRHEETTSYSSPEDNRIGAYAFEDRLWLDKLILPNSLKSIHEWAFDNQIIKIDTIVIGDSLEAFPLMNDTITTFEDCYSKSHHWLASYHASFVSCCGINAYIEASSKNPHFTSINGSLYDKEVTTLLRCYPRGIIENGFPKTLKHIGNGIDFSTAYELIEMPENLVSIGHFGIGRVTGWNFAGVGKEHAEAPTPHAGKAYINTLHLTGALESIGDYGLVNYPSDRDFCTNFDLSRGCQNTHIILGENVKYIGYRAFYKWESFQKGRGNEMLYCLSAIPPEVRTEAFFGEYSTGWADSTKETYKHKCVVVPMGSKVAYEQVPGIANHFEEIIEVDDVMAYYQEQVATDIEEIENSGQSPKEIGRYNLQGIRLAEPTRGVNIIKYSNGSVKKIWVK